MNTVILLGTEHPVQLGEVAPVAFRAVLAGECEKNNVKAIAEEISKDANTIALTLSVDLNPKLKHLYADPDITERMARGIPVDIELDIINEYRDKYPNISMWPREVSKDNLPKEVWEEYSKRTDVAYRMREQIWLEKIYVFNVWPLLFICGTNHFDEFAKLLRDSEINVIESYKHWMPDDLIGASVPNGLF